jgi:TonB family protein
MRKVLIALLLVASTANAANWVPIGELDSKGGVLLLDTTRIDRVNELRKAWFKYVYQADQAIPGGYPKTNSAAKSYRKDLRLMYFKCTERKVGLSQSTLRSATEAVVGDMDYSQYGVAYREVPPESLAELMLNAVCEWKLPGDADDVKPAKLQAPDAATDTATDESQIDPPAKMTQAANPNFYYPGRSIRALEEGSPIVKACVGPKGALLRQPEVTESSGFPDLDAAAVRVAKATKYAAATENGAPLPESCVKFKVKFLLPIHR